MTCKNCDHYGSECDGVKIPIRVNDNLVFMMCEGEFRFHEPMIMYLVMKSVSK